MTVREIVLLGSPVLREIAQPISFPLSPEVSELAQDMLDTLQSTFGVGLAANQVGEALQMMVIASRPRPAYPNAPEIPPFVLINPEILERSEESESGYEGCLSIPGYRGEVRRILNLKVRYHDLSGTLVLRELNGFPARIFQHEYDHLQGVMYIDRMENISTLMSEQEYQRRLVK